jgi:HEAT repeat protein
MDDMKAPENVNEALRSADWTVRRTGVLALAQGELTLESRNELWTLVDRDSDADVRAAAITVLAKGKDDRIVPYLLKNIDNESAPIRLGVAIALWRTSELVPSDGLDAIWRVLVEEGKAPVQAALARAVLSLDSDAAMSRMDDLLNGYTIESIRAGAFLLLLNGWQEQLGTLSNALGKGAAKLGKAEDSFELDRQRFKLDPAASNLLNVYILDDTISDIRAASIGLWVFDEEGIDFETTDDKANFGSRLAGGLRQWAKTIDTAAASWWDFNSLHYEQELVAEAMAGLPWVLSDAPAWPDRALGWFKEHREVLENHETRSRIVGALWSILRMFPQAVETLMDLVGVDEFFKKIGDHPEDLTAGDIGRAILFAEDGPHLEAMHGHAADSTPFVAAVLRDQSRDLRARAAEWIAKRASHIDARSVGRLIDVLTAMKDTDDDPEIQNKARAALIELTAQRRKLSILPLIELLRAHDEEKAHEALEQLDELSTSEASRSIVNEWVSWLALGRKGPLIESAADKLRQKPDSVLPLLNHLMLSMTLTEELKAVLLGELVPDEVLQLISQLRKDSGSLSDASRQRLSRWLRSTNAGIGQSEALLRADELESDLIEGIIQQGLEVKRANREQEVRRRISQHLLEMSEERFFGKDTEAYERVNRQLELHAVPTLSTRLSSEEGVEVRENIARILGNLGGKTAVDALARAVSGEERTRNARQQLLSTYYLEPSKEQSSEAARLLTTAVADARGTLRVLQILNFVFAAIGLGVLAIGLYLLLFTTTPELQLAGGAISVLAFFGLVLQIIREPLDRIQNAMNRLVQLETAFTSFIWELNLNSTFIQSQYVANGILSTSEVGDTVDRIEGAMRLSMDLVASYADEKPGSRITPSISSISPAVVKNGDRVRVRGMWLSGGRSSRGQHGVSVLIDHRPIRANVLSVSDYDVQFRSSFESAPVAADASQVHWLSLSIGGQETNALSLQIR